MSRFAMAPVTVAGVASDSTMTAMANTSLADALDDSGVTDIPDTGSIQHDYRSDSEDTYWFDAITARRKTWEKVPSRRGMP